ncbi:copper resistance protein B [Ponticaulis sp.]|uniref:copper resistance protein B n=1 Tax=Ponticaulis sp. TaxID=2020902 RepID=UPI000B749F7E|nr:copper resistance protein B [Ponticaulis sp.]MAI89275.1 copper resistance protein CopB [Ponticaulis sp.]OUY01261.1 MAG: hypothetical protein CBB65_02170 [Hyphomonadaceae bacterium TMED5]|tara:strand:- start:6685 stop:7503 length:819 start_codon:yes stop_codon:yes gene_type:complete
MRQELIKLIAGTTLAGGLITAPAYAQHDGHNGASDAPPPWSQADEVWGAEEMAESRNMLLHHHGSASMIGVNIDRFEYQLGEDEAVGVFDADLWYGGDINKLWFKTEGEYNLDHSELEEFEVQALWSRAISPYWDFQTGIRYDFEPNGLAHAVAGFQGMAPYRFEVDGAAFFSEDGDLTADVEVEYEFMLTQKLELIPRVELGWSAQEIPELMMGEGFTSAEAGLRLAYGREFAPYIGVEWHGSFGETEDILSAAGETTDDVVVLVGFSAWF